MIKRELALLAQNSADPKLQQEITIDYVCTFWFRGLYLVFFSRSGTLHWRTTERPSTYIFTYLSTDDNTALKSTAVLSFVEIFAERCNFCRTVCASENQKETRWFWLKILVFFSSQDKRLFYLGVTFCLGIKRLNVNVLYNFVCVKGRSSLL